MLVEVLGVLRVDGREPPSTSERRVLTALVVDRGRPVRVDALVDALWGDEPPASARNALQSKVSRLRALVGRDRIERVASGYVLHLERDELDADRFADLAAQARRADDGDDPARRVAGWDDALALWRGRAFEEFADEPFAQASATALEVARREAEDHRLAALADLGAHAAVAAAAERLLAEDPYREATWRALVLALLAGERRVDALRACREARTSLAEVGLDLPIALVELERRALEVPTVHEVERAAPEPGPDEPGPGEPGSSPVAERRGEARAVGAGAALPPLTVDPVVRLSSMPAWSRLALVEREGHLAALRTAVEEGAAGTPRYVALAGGPGSGTTRLAAAAAQVAADAGHRVVTSRALPEVDLPLGPLARLGLAGLDEEDGPRPDDPTAGAASVARRLVDAIGGDPTLVVLEDLHWADEPAARTLEHLLAEAAARVGTCRLTVVATHRPLGDGPTDAVLARLARQQGAQLLSVPDLREPGVAALVAEVAGARPVPSLVHRLMDQTAGNPLLVTATLHRWIEGGALRRSTGQVHLDRRSADGVPAVPDLDRGARQALARCSPEATEVVALVAVTAIDVACDLADAATVEVVGRATGLEPGTVRASLAELVTAGLLDGPGHQVAHPRIRSVVLDQLGPAGRGRVLALAVEAVDDAADALPAPFVHHLLERASRAGVVVPAAEVRAGWAARAARQAFQLGAWAVCADAATTALALGVADADEAATLTYLAGVARFRDHDEAAAHELLGRVIEEAGPGPPPEGRGAMVADAVLLRHRMAMAMGGDDEQLATARAEVADALEDLTPALQARALAQLAEAAFAVGDGDGAEAAVARARRCLVVPPGGRALGDEVASVAAEVDFADGLVRLHHLSLDEAAQRFRASSAAALAVGDPWLSSWGAGRLPLVLLTQGDLAAAEAAVVAARELQAPLRIWSELTLTEALAAAAAAARCDWPAAVVHAEESERLAVRSGYDHAHLVALPVLALAHCRLGRPDDAWTAIGELAVGRGRTPWPFVALTQLAAGEADQALATVRSVPPRRRDGPPTLSRLPAVVATAAVATEVGDAGLAVRVADDLAHLRSLGVVQLPAWPVPLAAVTSLA